MGYTMKHGNSAVPFKKLGSSPVHENGDEHAFDKLKRRSKHKLPTIKQIGKKVKKDIKGAVSQIKSDIKNISEILRGAKVHPGHGEEESRGELLHGYPRHVRDPKTGQKTYEHKYWKKD